MRFATHKIMVPFRKIWLEAIHHYLYIYIHYTGNTGLLTSLTNIVGFPYQYAGYG